MGYRSHLVPDGGTTGQVLTKASATDNDLTWSTGVLAGYAAKTTTYGVLATDDTINCTSGTFTVTLLTAVGIAGQVFIIKNSGTGVITIATTSSQTIDGGASGSILLNQYDALEVQSDGANWIII